MLSSMQCVQSTEEENCYLFYSLTALVLSRPLDVLGEVCSFVCKIRLLIVRVALPEKDFEEALILDRPIIFRASVLIFY